MAKTSKRYTIPGSERRAMPGARAAAPVMPEERIEVSMRIRAKPGQRDLDAGDALADQPPAQRRYLSRDEFASQHGAAAADIAKVAAFAKAHGLAVVESSARAPDRGPVRHRSGAERGVRDDAPAVRARRRHLPRPHRHRSASRPIWPASSKASSASTTVRRRRRTSRCSAPTRRRSRARPGRIVHAAATGGALRLPDRRRRHRPVHRASSSSAAASSRPTSPPTSPASSCRCPTSRRSASTAAATIRPTPTAPTAR